MPDNLLSPGFAGLPSAKPSDQEAVPPMAMPAPGPSSMQTHYMSQEDKAAEGFKKIAEAKAQADVMLEELEQLAGLADTVTTDDVVKAAAKMVAAGLPAVGIASTLATMPDSGGETLQGWVKEKLQAAQGLAEKVDGAHAQSAYHLGRLSMQSIIAHSAEEHGQRQRLAAAQIPGRMN